MKIRSNAEYPLEGGEKILYHIDNIGMSFPGKGTLAKALAGPFPGGSLYPG